MPAARRGVYTKDRHALASRPQGFDRNVVIGRHRSEMPPAIALLSVWSSRSEDRRTRRPLSQVGAAPGQGLKGGRLERMSAKETSSETNCIYPLDSPGSGFTLSADLWDLTINLGRGSSSGGLWRRGAAVEGTVDPTQRACARVRRPVRDGFVSPVDEQIRWLLMKHLSPTKAAA